MSTYAQFRFELNDDVIEMNNALINSGKWNRVVSAIRKHTMITSIFADELRGVMTDYTDINYFNDDAQIALEIIEKNYLQIKKVML